MLQTAAPQQTGPPPIKDEEWARDLLAIIQDFDRAEQFVREKQVRKWRKQICYWNNLQYIWWSEMAHDWRTPDERPGQQVKSDDEVDMDPDLYAKVVNIYRAHGEVIIAAMSASTPSVVFPPADADNPDDVLTSKVYSKISDLIQRHNYADLLLMKALFILYNQGLVCAYNENRQDESYGFSKIPVDKDFSVVGRNNYCPNCGVDLGSETVSETPMDEEPTEETVLPANNLEEETPQMTQCPNCGPVMPESDQYEDQVTKTVGYEQVAKKRECIDVYGPLHVKVPAYIMDQKKTPYLFLETDEHYAEMQDVYPEIAEFIEGYNDTEYFERQYRTPKDYVGDLPRDLCNVKRCWLRPWTFNKLGNVKDEGVILRIKNLRGKFPKGVYVVVINENIVAEAVPDLLDEHWTLSHHPLADSIHAEPIGSSLMPIQDMTNELANLTMENIEHSIPETFVDSETLNLTEYKKSEARPGSLYGVTRKMGEALGQSFHEVKGGTLSKEVDLFGSNLQNFAQFAVGSLPSIWGGVTEGSGGTASEYQTQRSQALQRLSITWRLLTVWWTQLMEKAVKSYAKSMSEDEKYPVKKGMSWANVWIKRSEMNGITGEAYPDSSEQLPVSWAQKRDILMNLLNMQNEQVMEVLSHSENASLVARLIGVPELYIPGDDDRNKQLYEIGILIQQEPIDEQNPITGEPMMLSSVPVDPELDNHTVEADTIAAWMKSDVGLDMKENQPAAYANCLAHYKEHRFQEAMQAQAEMEAESATADGEEEEESKSKPVKK